MTTEPIDPFGAGTRKAGMTELDELWGGILSGFDLNIAEHQLTFRVTTWTWDVRKVYRLTFTGVTSFSLTNEISDRWNYIELTEIRTSPAPNGQTVTDLVLWSEPSGCQIVADVVAIESLP